jgi:hypothetical protein
MRDFRNGPFPSANLTIAFSSLDQIRCNPVVITGLVFRRVRLAIQPMGRIVPA